MSLVINRLSNKVIKDNIMSDTYKVVINGCYGGFGLSQLALNILYKNHPDMVEVYEDYLGNEKMYLKYEVARHDKRLIEVVETLGSEDASGDCANLVIETIYNPVYRVSEYDGYESIHTQDMDEGWVIINEDSL